MNKRHKFKFYCLVNSVKIENFSISCLFQKFPELVLGLLQLIVAKCIDVAQPIWL